ncbi:hypothetical protein F5Y16DRAFT_140962 [Xylariaceae sp. FL0255]|nr:hypothetical protein F5Y16DRAFT_140962 [Xylariaceae sp. FL0255]
MPAEDYASVGTGGALRLKGAKVQKSKKKKKDKKDKDKEAVTVERELSTSNSDAKQEVADEPENEYDAPEYKTEAERRHEEAAAKKMQKMLQDPALASEIRKTHKERVEGLNTYLSKLSEHHDMPKIGPG